MKIFITISVLVLSSILNSCSNSNNPVKPLNNQGTGDAILIGEIQLVRMEKKNYNLVDEDWDGIKVELLGTQLFTETDKHGKWKIKDIDSGSYSVRFTKFGFDTLIVSEVILKTQDSIWLKQTVQDSTKTLSQTIDILFLTELPSKLEILSGDVSIVEKVTEIKDSHDTTHVIRRDTTFDFHSKLMVKHTSQFSYTENYNNVRYMFCISEKQTLEQSEIPSSFSPWQAWQNDSSIFVRVAGKEDINQGSIRTFYVNDISQSNSFGLSIMEYGNKRGISLQKGKQLYFHVIFNWGGMKRTINQDKKAVWTTAAPVDFYTPLYSIPIEWK